MNEYFNSYIDGMTNAITSDAIVTSLFIGSATVAARKGLTAGVATFFLGYAAMGEVTNLAMTINGAARGLAGAVVARQQNIIPSPDTSSEA